MEVLPWVPGADLVGRHWTWDNIPKWTPGTPTSRTPGGTEQAGDKSSPEKNPAIIDDRIVREMDARTTV